MITDQNGNEISRMAFDPFGKRLTEHVGSSVLSQSAANDSSYHGYTGHSQLDHLGLVHMGGRVYDPDSGRFLSADLFVQSPYNTQSYNRYSYVFNNPLRNTDPSGYLSREDEAKKAPEEVLVLGHRISQQSNSLNMSLGFMSLFSSANSSFGGLPSGMISGFGVTSKMDRYIGKLGVRARNGDIGAMQALQNIRKQQKALQKKLRTGGLNGEGLSLGAQKGGDGESVGSSGNKEAFLKKLGALNAVVDSMGNFDSKDGALNWLHENVHPLAVDYDFEITANIFSDGIDFRIGSLGTVPHAHTFDIYSSKAPGPGWRWKANWHTHAAGGSSGFSGQDRSLYSRMYQKYPNLTYHVSFINWDGRNELKTY